MIIYGDSWKEVGIEEELSLQAKITLLRAVYGSMPVC